MNQEIDRDEPLVKATFYLSEADVMLLERLRLQRRSHGQRTDKSALVREAVRQLASKELSQ